MYKLFNNNMKLNKGIENEIYFDPKKDLYSRINEQKNKDDKLIKKSEKGYQDILNAIENIPNCFVETRGNIKKCVDTYLEILNHINDNKLESTYKTGFYDGISIMLEYLETRKPIK